NHPTYNHMDKPSPSTDSGHSVIYNAPPEIILAILGCLLASSQALPHGRKYRDLILFTHISSRLRSIAVSTPTLWTRIEITDRPTSFELAKTCLRRSGSQKLDINIRVATRIGARLPGIIALVDYVAVRTERLSMHLVLRKESQWTQIQDALQALVSPILGELELKFSHDDGVHTRNEIPSIFLPTLAQGIRSLVLKELVPAIQPTLLGILKKLVLISNTDMSWPLAHMREVLDQCKQLECLELVANPDNAANHTSPPREPAYQTLPKLRLLILKGHSSSFVSLVLQV
ncbi:hypothetical protein FRC01_014307, partial [Tulasnella sp. 417]